MAEQETVTLVDYTEAVDEQEAPEPLPVGTYEGSIRTAEARISNNSGNKYAALSIFVPPDQYPADYDASSNPDGVVIRYNRLLLEDNPRARFQVRRFCEAIGVPAPGRQLDLNDWVGISVTVAVEHEMFDGMPREQITRIIGG